MILYWIKKYLLNGTSNVMYCIAGKFGGLVVCLSNRQIKIRQNFFTHIYTYGDPVPNCQIRLKWQFGTQPPNLIPANISGYMVYRYGNTINLILQGEGVQSLFEATCQAGGKERGA